MADIVDQLEALCLPDRRRNDRQVKRRTTNTVPCALLREAAQAIRELRAALQQLDREGP